MSKVKVVCTSTGAIKFAPERYQKLNIDTLQIHMIFQGREFLEGEMDPVWFYSELEKLEDPKNNLPRTALPTRAEIGEVFERAIAEGYDEMLVFTISSALGGTYNAIKLCADEYQDRITIHVIDTRCAGFGEGIHAIRAAQLLEQGLSTEEVLKEIEWGIAHQEFLGVDGKLDYLIYNGRLKGAKAFMGQMLKICPVLRMNTAGEILAVESVRTPKKALMRTCEMLKEIIGNRDPEDYILFHIFTGTSLLNTLKEMEPKYEISTNHEDVIMSPVSGCHNGPWLAGYGLYRLRRSDEELG